MAEVKDETTFSGRNAGAFFLFSWCLLMFILDGLAFPMTAPPGEHNWEYGPGVFFVVMVVTTFWGITSVMKTESAHAAELKRQRETKSLAELMSINMGA